MAIRGLTISTTFCEMLPCQDVPVGVSTLRLRPATYLDLERCVVAVYSKKIVYRSLGMRLILPPFSDLDVIHQIQGPEIVIDINKSSV